MENNLGLRLKAVLKEKGLTYQDLANMAGVTSSAVSQWITKNQIKGSNLNKACKALEISPNWLLTGKGMKEQSNIIIVDDRAQLLEGYISIPEYEINFGAGECFEPTFDEVCNSIPATYRKSFFEARGIDPKNCRRFHIKGDSMQPLIMDGDCVTVDCTPDQIIESNQVYAIIYSGTLRVKRLIKSLKTLTIKSENPIYPEEVLTSDEANELIKVIGRVIDRSGAI